MNIFSRTSLLLGEECTKYLSRINVIVFGVGGVGSWCVESLVRSGVCHLTIVDNDNVAETNINRQLMATAKTVGKSKVEMMRQRLLEINPDAKITAIHDTYNSENADSYHLEHYDYVIDAIDSLKDKVSLILHATQLAKAISRGETAEHGVSGKLTFYSSMGAALRIDPTMVRVTEFWKVRNDALARALRRKFKHNGQMPAVKFKCVYSEEVPMENKGTVAQDDTCDYKVQINGSLSHVTGIFGLTLAGLVLQDCVNGIDD